MYRCTIGLLLPNKNMTVCGTDDTQFTVPQRTTRETITLFEIFGKEHLTINRRHTYIIVNTDFSTAVTLTVVFAHTYSTKLKIACTIIHKNIIYICTGARSSCYLNAQRELVSIVKRHLAT